MKNLTLLMVGIVAAVTMLSAGLSIIPVQQASANIVMDEEDGGDTNFSFEQEQKNRCSGSAECSNEGTITFNVPTEDMIE
jgi:capsular polysaccharide biosynthesis protein